MSEEKKSFLPDFCSVRLLLGIVLSAELLAVVLTLAASGPPGGFLEALALRSMLVQWIAVSGAMLLCLLKKPLAKLPSVAAALAAWLLLGGVAASIAEATWRLLWRARQVHDTGAHGQLLSSTVGITLIVSALLLRYLYVQGQWRGQIQAENRARMQALQSRIRPHFLFNSMNTIAALTQTDADRAEQTVLDLADLFRASLADSATVSTLRNELELARGYLRIEQQRLGGRLRVEWDIDHLPDNVQMPKLLLQPLLENAIYHGIEPAPEGGTVRIAVRYRRRRINIAIHNPLPADGSTRDGNQVALDNVRQRLAGMFGDEAMLRATEVDGGYQLRLVFPHPWRS
ncbi:MAG TPA: sensor histidine kinase [Chromatiaceae bacterium]|nr:sensor histidine kinase [Chromatiaceae bacterium]